MTSDKMTQPATVFIDIDGVFHDGESELFSFAPKFFEAIRGHNVQLVVHSNWRLTMSFENIAERFPDYLRQYLAGMTNCMLRSESILAYVKEHSIKRFIVIDDSIEGFPADWICDGTLLYCSTGEGVQNKVILDALRRFLAKSPRV